MQKGMIKPLAAVGLFSMALLNGAAMAQTGPTHSSVYLQQMVGSLAGQIAQLQELNDALRRQLQESEGKVKELEGKVKSSTAPPATPSK